MTKKIVAPLIVVAVIIVGFLLGFTIAGWDNVIADFNYQYLDSDNTVSYYVGRSADITIPSKIYDVEITKIGGSFAKSTNLVLESVTMNDNIVEIADKAFSWECVNLKKVTLSNKLTYLGSSAFSGCTALESITIPSGVTEILDSTFANCTSLKSVTLPDGVKSISASAFTGCENVTVTYKGNTYDYAHIEDLVAAAA